MKQLHNIRYLRFITVFLGRRCNARCTYCVQGSSINAFPDKELNTDVIRYLVELSKVPRIDAGNKLEIVFYGGEPLLYWEDMKVILEGVCGNPETVRDNISFKVFTNGTLLDEEKVNMLNKHDVKVVLSYDGPNEETRPVRLREEQIPLFLKLKRRRVSFVCNYSNLDIYDSVMYLKKKFPGTGVDFAFCSFSKDTVPKPQVEVELVFERSMRKFLNYYKHHELDDYIMLAVFRRSRDIQYIDDKKYQGYFMSVDLEGKLYAFSDRAESIAGSIYEECFDRICSIRQGYFGENCKTCYNNDICRKHYVEHSEATCGLVKAHHNVWLKMKNEVFKIVTPEAVEKFFGAERMR